MATSYQVNVDALGSTVAKLHAVAESLAHPRASAAYDTTLGAGALGVGFTGSEVLQGAHTDMQGWVAEMIGTLQSFISTYGSQTKAATDAYVEQEHTTTKDFYSGS
jgi:hypothetical protein